MEVDAVLTSGDGTVWIGGDEGWDALHQGHVLLFREEMACVGIKVTSLLKDHAGQIWVGIHHAMSIKKNFRYTFIFC